MRPTQTDKPPRLWIVLLLAFSGAAVCLLGIGGFLWAVAANNLAWYPGQTAREFYLEVGQAYARGFTAGFFLCFFMVLGAVAVATLWKFRPQPEPASSSPEPAESSVSS